MFSPQLNGNIQNNFVDIILSAIPGVDFTKLNPSSSYEKERRECNCLPDCENTQYLAEMSSGVLCRKFSLNNANL